MPKKIVPKTIYLVAPPTVQSSSCCSRRRTRLETVGESCSPVSSSYSLVCSSQSRNYYPRTYKPTNIFLVPNRICLPLFLSSFSLFSPFFSFIYFLGGEGGCPLCPHPPLNSLNGGGGRRPKIRRTFIFIVNIMYNGTKKAEECCR